MSDQILYIATDCQNTAWLKYLCNEFKRINMLKANIQVIDIQSADPLDGKEVLFYTEEFYKNLNIINKSNISPNGKTSFISEDVFIHDKTQAEDNRFALTYDIFWNAFTFLSRIEEYQSENQGVLIKSYCKNHPRTNKQTFKLPIVNILFDILEKLLKNAFPSLEFDSPIKPCVDLTHDVDYITKTLPLRLKQTAFNSYNIIKSLSNWSQFKEKAKKTTHFLFSNPSYWCFDFWEDLEKKYNCTSTFFIYSHVLHKNLISLLLDPSYKISNSKSLQEKCKKLLDNGFQIGLHGSYYSATDNDLICKEKSQLEKFLDCRVTKTRQHWLNYQENKTPYIHNSHFEQDYSLGWNDIIGFRSGTLSKYKPFDHKQQKPFDYFVIPQVFMDSHIFDYNYNQQETTQKESLAIITSLNSFKNAHITISWHQRVCNADYQWHNFYEEILNAL